MKRFNTTRLEGLHAALGIGRLADLSRPSRPHGEALAAARRLEPATRRNILKAALMAMAAALGFWGFQVAAPLATPPQDPWQASVIWNNVFKTVQLLTTQFPDNLPTKLPWQLQIARFAMPIFAVWFTATALMRRFNRPLLAWAAGLRSGHVVLIGASEVSQGLARAYRRLGRPVVAIVPRVEGEAPSPMEQAGARVVFGEPAEPRLLRRAGVQRAGTLIAAEDLGTKAVTLASAVASANVGRAEGDRLVFLVRLGHRELRSLMASQIATAMRQNQVELRLYVRERAVARSLLSRYPADWGLPPDLLPGPHDLHAAIVGFGDMGTELLLQLARIAVPVPGARTILTVIDRDAEGLGQQFLAEHPGLAQCAELRFIKADIRPSAVTVEQAREWLLQPLAATSVYVCCGDDHTNLAMAIGLRRAYAQIGAVAAPLFVHQREGAALVDALPQIHAPSFDALRILPFGGIEQEADPFYLVDEEVDDLARLMHEDYLQTGGSGPAAVPWSELADSYRAANRSQADHVRPKLRRLGLHAVAGPGDVSAVEIDAARLEALGIQEHERWCRDRWLAGWRHGETRDDAGLRHPDLVPYEQLSEPVRDLDRQTVRRLPEVLGRLGIGLRRDRRVGVWFTEPEAAPARVAEVAAKLGAVTDHLQLILPLRSAAEYVLATTLARNASVAIEIALTELGASLDRRQVRELIAVADRAYVVAPSTDSLAAFRGLCDTVIVV